MASGVTDRNEQLHERIARQKTFDRRRPRRRRRRRRRAVERWMAAGVKKEIMKVRAGKVLSLLTTRLPGERHGGATRENIVLPYPCAAVYRFSTSIKYCDSTRRRRRVDGINLRSPG